MKKMLCVFSAASLSLFLLSSIASPQVTGKAMAKIWNGLADILERNIDSPDNAIAEADRFIQDNKKIFEAWRDSVQKNVERAKATPYQMPTKEEMAKAQEIMAKRSAAKAMNRWTNALIAFSMKHPEHTDRINDLMKPYSPQFSSDEP